MSRKPSEAVQIRCDAARALYAVVARQRTLDQALGPSTAPLTRELVAGSLRHFFSLSAAVDARIRQPLREKDRDIWCLMIVGAYQLRHTRIPDHAALFETVNACSALRKVWAKGLVNAVLRQVAPPPDATPAGSAAPATWELPPWLEQRLRADHSENVEPLLASAAERAPMALRINTARISVADYRTRLAAAGIAGGPPRMPGGDAGPGAQAWVLAEPRPVETLPGHAEGLVSVQDAAAQFAPGLLGVRPGERVLDACAAPGGKLFHLLEACPGLEVTALEQAPARLERIRQDGARLGHGNLDLRLADATGVDWWDGTPYQRVLLDAPCSGTGTLRRHPDIKVLRRPADVTAQAALQRRLLENLWRVVEPGGSLLYCTCSILTEENDAVVGAFLAGHDDAHPQPIALGSGRPLRHGWQLLPTNPDTDGFYYACLVKALQTRAP